MFFIGVKMPLFNLLFISLYEFDVFQVFDLCILFISHGSGGFETMLHTANNILNNM